MAYLINCHKNEEQVNNLITQLDYDGVDFYIHVDSKSNMMNKIIQKDNIYFTKERVDVVWGDSSQVIAIMKLFELVAHSGINYQYVHLLSGQDYPLKSNIEIEAFFKQHIGKQFIDCVLMEGEWLRRVNVYYPRIMRGNELIISIIRAIYSRFIMWSIIFRRNTKEYPCFYQGSCWFSVTGDAMLYILNFLQNNSKFLKFLDNTLCCDEFVFQTILANSKYKNEIVENMRYIDWSEKKPSPKILKESDLPSLFESNKIFARKFDISIDKNVVEIIKQNISIKN